MPLLDVSEIILDPDFLSKIMAVRNTQVVGADGVAVNTPKKFTFYGVVTSDRGLQLMREDPAGAYMKQGILIITKTRLISGQDLQQVNTIADVVEWDNNHYVVVRVDVYTHFGRGFVQAYCELLELPG